MKNPLPIRFSGTWSQDCDIVLYLSLPLGQYMRRSAPVGLCLLHHLCGRPCSPQSPGPGLPPGWVLSPLRGGTWLGLGRGAQGECGPSQGNQQCAAVGQCWLPASSCPCSLEGPQSGTSGGALQMYNTEHRCALQKRVPLLREGLSADCFTWKNPAAHRPERNRLETRV